MEMDSPNWVNHADPPVPPTTQRLNSLLPQVTREVMDALLKEVWDQPDPARLREIFAERLDLFRRENFTLYQVLDANTTPEQLGWVVFAYRALAAQNQQDMRWPS